VGALEHPQQAYQDSHQRPQVPEHLVLELHEHPALTQDLPDPGVEGDLAAAGEGGVQEGDEQVVEDVVDDEQGAGG